MALKLQDRDMVELLMHIEGTQTRRRSAVAFLEERGNVVVHEGGCVLKGLCMKGVGARHIRRRI